MVFYPEEGAQLLQASAQAFLIFGKKKGKGKGKGKGNKKGQISCSPVTLFTGGSSTAIERIESEK